jgi:hypothetical protein
MPGLPAVAPVPVKPSEWSVRREGEGQRGKEKGSGKVNSLIEIIEIIEIEH